MREGGGGEGEEGLFCMYLTRFGGGGEGWVTVSESVKGDGSNPGRERGNRRRSRGESENVREIRPGLKMKRKGRSGTSAP
jgi:hypothetical protein